MGEATSQNTVEGRQGKARKNRTYEKKEGKKEGKKERR